LLVIFLYNANCALKCKMGRIAVIRWVVREKYKLQTASYG